MSIAKKCDICGKLYEPYKVKIDDREVNSFVFVNNVDEEGFYVVPDKAYDCCPECIKRIANYVDELRNGAEKKETRRNCANCGCFVAGYGCFWAAHNACVKGSKWKPIDE